VPPEKQKILYKGKVIKEDSQLKTLDIPEGSTVMLMRTFSLKCSSKSSRQSKEPCSTKKLWAYFYVIQTVIPFGLVNLGNTCYINSTLQVLVKIPEFRKAVQERKNMESIGESSALVKGLANVFQQLEVSGQSVKPMSFIQVVKS
jgi:ubiquitin carboxyl-terminal hydrolase 14